MLHAAVLVAFPEFAIDRRSPSVAALDVILFAPGPVADTSVVPPSAGKPREARTHDEGSAPRTRHARATPAVARDAPGATSQPRARVDANLAGPVTHLPPEGSADGAHLVSAASAVGRDSPPTHNAAYLHNPRPAYPLIARRNGEHGTVTLRVLVARDGAPASVSVERSSGFAHLDRSALATVKGWRFVPAQERGEPVEAWMLVPIVFRLEGTS